MGPFILGLIILLVGLFGSKETSPIAKFKGIIILIGIVVMIIGLATSSIRQIEAGHVGVQIVFGDVEEGFLPEGLRFVLPWKEVEQMSIRTKNYTMSSTYEEGQQEGDDAIRVKSKDGLDVVIDLTILYRVQPQSAWKIFQSIGLNFQDVVIRPVTRTRIREVSVFYNATDLYTEKREAFEKLITQKLETDFKNRGIMLEQLLIRKIKLPQSVEESIERKITAIQEAERMEFVLAKEKQEAERKRVEARGNADAQIILAQSLTDKVLQFEYMKVQRELAKSPNSKIILMGSGKSSPPIILGN